MNSCSREIAKGIDRGSCPVFVVGCARSGTTLLYHLLLSAGGFAYYRAESHVYDVLAPRFGNLRTVRERERLMNAWLDSALFARSGLDAAEIRSRVVKECRNGGDFLRTIMDALARMQGVERWADCTPAHVLHMLQIKSEIPNAIFVHLIRDGRDVALSLQKTGWVTPFAWDGRKRLLVAGLRWEWVVEQGRISGKKLGPDYVELRFEDLVIRPRSVLHRLSEFIGQELNYERIQQNPIGAVINPNTSFPGESESAGFKPVERWKRLFPKNELMLMEAVAGKSLQMCGYELACSREKRLRSHRLGLMRTSYRAHFALKHWAKTKTPLGRIFTDINALRN